MNNRRSGFTLTEMLMTVSILIVIVVSIILYLDPIERRRQANNARRASDVEKIADAFQLLRLDSPSAYAALRGELSEYKMITNGLTDGGQCITVPDCTAQPVTGCVRIQDALNEYLPQPPYDPDEEKGSAIDVTGYYAAFIGGQLQVGVCAPDMDQDGTLPFIQAIR